MRTFTVTGELDGERLDKLLAELLPEFTRGDLQKLIKAGDVLVNGSPAKKSHAVRAGDVVAVRVAGLEDVSRLEVEPVPLALDILFEDSDLIVVNKPAGLVVHPATGGRSETLVAGLLHHCGELAEAGDPLRPGIVHRLDRDTSGVIVAARTEKARASLVDQFRERRVRKRYLAVVREVPGQPEGEITHAIGRHGRIHDRMAVRALTGRRAITHYAVIERFRRFTLLAVFPRTGRTHQIRVHLSAIGHPIVADGPYGGGGAVYASELAGGRRGPHEPPLIDRQALHAETLTFRHPSRDAEVSFTAPLPEDISRLLEALRRLRAPEPD